MFKPVTKLFCWWFKFSLPDGATYFVMPDGFAILGLFLLPSFFVPGIYFANIAITISALLLSPLILLSLLRVKDGRVVHINLFLFLPYWLKRVPENSKFEIYEAWGDPAPSGVAFTLPPKNHKYLHIGTTSTAHALEQAVGATLRSQGWRPDPKWLCALTLQVRPTESEGEGV